MKNVTMFGQEKYNLYIKENSVSEIVKLIKQHQYTDAVIIYDNKLDLSIINDCSFFTNVLGLDVSEAIKNIDTINQIISFFITAKIKKKQTLILGIGGGVISDMVGFAASIYMRGVSVAYVPTTLLAMVDASLGSKNGIDFEGKKNNLGTFYDPKFVLIDPNFLKTLPERQISSGIAEIIKISYLSNSKILDLLDSEQPNYQKIIYLAATAKNKFIKKDYYDQKERQFLNFGHTYGHGLEAYYDFKKYTHGEAVGLGMCLAHPDPKLYRLLQKYKLPTELEVDLDIDKLFELMKFDKKNINNQKVRIIKIAASGKPYFDQLENSLDLKKAVQQVRMTNEKNN